MSEPALGSFLSGLRTELAAAGRADNRLLAEVEDHLLEAVDNGLREGHSREQAARKAVSRFGSPETIARILVRDVPQALPFDFVRENAIMLRSLLLAIAGLTTLMALPTAYFTIVQLDHGSAVWNAAKLVGALLTICIAGLTVSYIRAKPPSQTAIKALFLGGMWLLFWGFDSIVRPFQLAEATGDMEYWVVMFGFVFLVQGAITLYLTWPALGGSHEVTTT